MALAPTALAVSAVDLVATIGQSIGQIAPTHRQCHINIVNACSSYTLVNPSWHLDSGKCASPLPPTIPSNGFGSALFIKTPNTARGSVGVMTYDLLSQHASQPSEKMAIMFSNPYDFNIYSNQLALGVFEQTRECDGSLYNEMNNNTNQYFIRTQPKAGVIKYEGQRIRIEATMSDIYQPVMKVHVSETK